MTHIWAIYELYVDHICDMCFHICPHICWKPYMLTYMCIVTYTSTYMWKEYTRQTSFHNRNRPNSLRNTYSVWQLNNPYMWKHMTHVEWIYNNSYMSHTWWNYCNCENLFASYISVSYICWHICDNTYISVDTIFYITNVGACEYIGDIYNPYMWKHMSHIWSTYNSYTAYICVIYVVTYMAYIWYIGEILRLRCTGLPDTEQRGHAFNLQNPVQSINFLTLYMMMKCISECK